MGRAVDILHTACGQLLDDTKLIHDKNFMMNLFDEISKEILEKQLINTPSCTPPT